MTTQFDYLSAILSLGLVRKVQPEVDLSKADWSVLEPFLNSNHLDQITRRAFTLLSENKQPVPPAQVVKRFMDGGLTCLSHGVSRKSSIIAFSRQWVEEEGKRPLAIGGTVFSRFYPNASLRTGDELVCIPLRRNAPDDVQVGTTDEQTLEFPSLRVVVPDSAVGPFGTNSGEEADAVLRSVFFSAPCMVDPHLGLAYPNPEFLALYHLYAAQQLLLHSRMPFIMFLDWIMLLHTLLVHKDSKLDWAAFQEHVSDLGLLRFSQRLTVLGLRLTGIVLDDERIGWLTTEVTDKDVDYLYKCIVTGVEADSASEQERGRFSRFADVLRNSKKYSRFSDVSPAKQAFRYLFS